MVKPTRNAMAIRIENLVRYPKEGSKNSTAVTFPEIESAAKPGISAATKENSFSSGYFDQSIGLERRGFKDQMQAPRNQGNGEIPSSEWLAQFCGAYSRVSRKRGDMGHPGVLRIDR